jgi:ABC-type dipeptide/oligopeptide/nickel transport system permease subunit
MQQEPRAARPHFHLYTQWWISTFPGIAIMLTGLACSLLGAGLAEALEVPR